MTKLASKHILLIAIFLALTANSAAAQERQQTRQPNQAAEQQDKEKTEEEEEKASSTTKPKRISKERQFTENLPYKFVVAANLNHKKLGLSSLIASGDRELCEADWMSNADAARAEADVDPRQLAAAWLRRHNFIPANVVDMSRDDNRASEFFMTSVYEEDRSRGISDSTEYIYRWTTDILMHKNDTKGVLNSTGLNPIKLFNENSFNLPTFFKAERYIGELDGECLIEVGLSDVERDDENEEESVDDDSPQNQNSATSQSVTAGFNPQGTASNSPFAGFPNTVRTPTFPYLPEPEEEEQADTGGEQQPATSQGSQPTGLTNAAGQVQQLEQRVAGQFIGAANQLEDTVEGQLVDTVNGAVDKVLGIIPFFGDSREKSQPAQGGGTQQQASEPWKRITNFLANPFSWFKRK